MNDIATNRVGPMQNPPYLGEPIHESMAMWPGTRPRRRRGSAANAEYCRGC